MLRIKGSSVTRLKCYINDQRGESIITLPIVIMFIIIVLYIGIDVIGAFTTYEKLQRATTETLTLMKMENGWDNNTEIYFNTMLSREGLSLSNVQITATPKQVQRGEIVTIQASTNYEVRSLRPLNRTISLPINIEISGLAQEFIR
jgi:hypothetical protein